MNFDMCQSKAVKNNFHTQIFLLVSALHFDSDILQHFLFHFSSLWPSSRWGWSVLFLALGQQRSSLLSPSQLAAAHFCSGRCVLTQTDAILYYFFLMQLVLISCFGEAEEVWNVSSLENTWALICPERLFKANVV